MIEHAGCGGRRVGHGPGAEIRGLIIPIGRDIGRANLAETAIARGEAFELVTVQDLGQRVGRRDRRGRQQSAPAADLHQLRRAGGEKRLDLILELGLGRIDKRALHPVAFFRIAAFLRRVLVGHVRGPFAQIEDKIIQHQRRDRALRQRVERAKRLIVAREPSCGIVQALRRIARIPDVRPGPAQREIRRQRRPAVRALGRFAHVDFHPDHGAAAPGVRFLEPGRVALGIGNGRGHGRRRRGLLAPADPHPDIARERLIRRARTAPVEIVGIPGQLHRPLVEPEREGTGRRPAVDQPDAIELAVLHHVDRRRRADGFRVAVDVPLCRQACRLPQLLLLHFDRRLRPASARA